MNHESVHLRICQKIKYQGQDDYDQWVHECQGHYIALSTYSRIRYRDQNQKVIQVKWSPLDQKSAHYLVEFKQENYSMIFHPFKATHTPYQTGQGLLALEVVTQSIRLSPSEIQVSYQIHIDGEAIGQYDFQLQYQ